MTDFANFDICKRGMWLEVACVFMYWLLCHPWESSPSVCTSNLWAYYCANVVLVTEGNVLHDYYMTWAWVVLGKKKISNAQLLNLLVGATNLFIVC